MFNYKYVSVCIIVENNFFAVNPKETHTFDLTLRIDGQMLPSHLVKYETVIGPEISLLGQHLTCTAGIGKVSN